MGKDRHGRFIPPKGKPSGSGRESELGLRPDMPPEKLDRDREMTEKYTAGEEKPAPGLHVRHRNRHIRSNEMAKDRGSQPVSPEQKADAKKTEMPVNAGSSIRTMDRDAFEALANYEADLCITIVMQTHQYGMDVNEQKDALKFKNSLLQVKHRLEQLQWEPEAMDALLAPAYGLLQNDAFWRRMGQGLVVYLAKDFFRYYLLPEAPEQGLYVNHSFYMAPLLSLLNNREQFFLLSLTKQRAKLYKGDAFGMEEVNMPELPGGDSRLLYRTTSATNNEVHNAGLPGPPQPTNMQEYLRNVDEVLWKHALGNANAPLLLAAADDMVPLYRQASRYQYIYEKPLHGNFEAASANDLHRQAREVLQPYFEAPVKKALDNYLNHSATALTSSIPADVIPAAYYGRVSYLFVCRNGHIWGSFDKEGNRLDLHEAPQHDNDCLCAKAAVQTILNGGEVYVVDKEKMPADSLLAAFMRY